MAATSRKAPAYVVMVDDKGNTVNFGEPADGSVTTEKIADGAITGAKIASNAITAGKIASGAITDAKLANPKANVPSTIEPIADPSTATPEDIANAYNALLTALKG